MILSKSFQDLEGAPRRAEESLGNERSAAIQDATNKCLSGGEAVRAANDILKDQGLAQMGGKVVTVQGAGGDCARIYDVPGGSPRLKVYQP